MFRSKYIKQTELMLKILPEIFGNDNGLDGYFALKGGTAINFFVRNMPRFSVDVDLVYLPKEPRELFLQNMTRALEKLTSKIEQNLAGSFFNNEQGEINVDDNWISVSKGFVNHRNMYIGNSFQVKGDYFVSDNGKISSGPGLMMIYLTGKHDNAFSLESDSILEKRAGPTEMTLVTTEGGMYFGYNLESSNQERERLMNLELGISNNAPAKIIKEFPEFTYVGSQLLSRGSGIYMKSKKDVVFEGANAFSGGDFHVETAGNFIEKPLVWRYSVDSWTEVSTQHSGSRKVNYEGIKDSSSSHRSVSLLPKFIIRGNKIIDAGKDVIFSGSNNLVEKDLIVNSGGDIIAESVEVLYSNSDDTNRLAYLKSLPDLDDPANKGLVEFGDAQLSNEARIAYVGGNFLVGGNVFFTAKKNVKHLGTTVVSYGGKIKFVAEEGDVITAARLGMYLREINSNEILYKPEIRPTILASINGTLMALDGTVLNSGSVISVKDFLEIIAKNIELKAASETVTQFRYDRDDTLLSTETRKTWETQTETSLATLAAKHIDLTATDRFYSEGADIRTQEGAAKITAPEITIADHVVPHEVTVEIEKSGLKVPGIIPGIADALTHPHTNLKDSIINSVPIIQATKNLWNMKSPTDLLPIVEFGTEVLRVLTATSWQEALLDQAGLTLVNGIPVPNGLGFYTHTEKTKQTAEQSIPSVLKGPDILIEGDDITIIGSKVVGEDISINANNKLKVKPAMLRIGADTEIEDEQFSFSFSGGKGGGLSSFGFRIGEGSGYRRGSGHNLAYSYIGSGNELETTVNINVKNDAIIASPIEANKINVKAGSLLVETLQEIWNERSNYRSWSAGLSFVSGSPYPIPTGSVYGSNGRGERRWAEVPAWIKGEEVFLDIDKECKLIGGGILGRNVTLNAQSLNWVDIYNKDEYQETSAGFDSGNLAGMAGIGSSMQNDWSFSNIATRTGGIVKGFFSFSHSGYDKEGAVRSTISEGADINLREPKDLNDLNRDESKMTETTRDDDYTYSIGVPIVDFKELRERLEESWILHSMALQQKTEDKNLSEPEQELLETKKEVFEFVQEEAMESGLSPEDVQDVIEELTKEEFAAKNLEKLNEYHDGKEFSVDELEQVLSGKIPVKDGSGKINFVDVVDKTIGLEKSKHTETTFELKKSNDPVLEKSHTIDKDIEITRKDSEEQITLSEDYIAAQKERIKKGWREIVADTGETLISFYPVAGPPIGAEFSQLVKGEFDAEKTLEGLAWGAADFTIAGWVRKFKNIRKLATVAPKVEKLLKETKKLSKVKVTKTARWKTGEDIYKSTSKGEPAWSTVKRRFWKSKGKDMTLKEVGEEYGEKYAVRNFKRMKQGKPPQRMNKDKIKRFGGDGLESKELHHEPIPRRDGGKKVTDLWPQEHAARDAFRRPGY